MLEPKAEKPISTAVQLEKIQCQLLSLEVSLQNAIKAGIISRERSKPRLDFLEIAKSRLTHLRMLTEINQKDPTEADLGLPKLESCSFDELKILDYFLSQRLQKAQRLQSELNKMLDWVAQAIQGKKRFFATWRLAKLKKLLTRVNNDTLQSELDEKHMEKIASRFAHSLKSRSDQIHLAGNLEVIVTLFSEIDTLNHRITTLTSSLNREEEATGKLEEWLRTNELAAKTTPMAMPNQEAIEQARAAVKSAFYPQINGEDRLTLARKFVNQCLEQNQKQKKDPWVSEKDFNPFLKPGRTPYANQ